MRPHLVPDDYAWLDELDLDPSSSWLRMHTRSLGVQPWLVVDDRRDVELALRADLLDSFGEDVLIEPPPHVGREVHELVMRYTSNPPRGAGSPFEAVARTVQEDLCLLQRRDGAWHLDAAALCFPSRWRLADKIGRPVVEVHGPTPGFADELAVKVDRLLDRLDDRPVLRRNWFVHPDASLHQPDPTPEDPVVPAADIGRGLHLRSERQTLRKLPSRWVLFTIRIQHAPLGVLLDDRALRHRFATYVAQAPMADLGHRGMTPAQVDAVCSGLGIRSRTRESDTTSDS